MLWAWGLKCDPLLGGPSPLHWLILTFALTGITVTLVYFFAAPGCNLSLHCIVTVYGD